MKSLYVLFHLHLELLNRHTMQTRRGLSRCPRFIYMLWIYWFEGLILVRAERWRYAVLSHPGRRLAARRGASLIVLAPFRGLSWLTMFQ